MEVDGTEPIWALAAAVLANLAKDFLRTRRSREEKEHHDRMCATREEVRSEMEAALQRRDERMETRVMKDQLDRLMSERGGGTRGGTGSQ